MMMRRFAQQIIDRAAGHVLGNYVRPSRVFTYIVDRHDIGMVAELGHRLRFAGDPRSLFLVETADLYECQRYLAVKQIVAREIDDLAAAFAEIAHDLVAPAAER